MELMKQNHLLKIGFVIFLRGAPFSDFVDYRLLYYMPLGIQICILLFWGIFIQISFSLIKQSLSNSNQHFTRALKYHANLQKVKKDL